MAVPNIFATQAAGPVPASYLDVDFAFLLAAPITWTGDSGRSWSWKDMDTAYGVGAGELLLQTDSANNVLAIQNISANAYSAIAFKDKNGVEQAAIGYSQASGVGNIFPSYTYLEVSGFDHVSGPANGFLLFQTGTYSATLGNWVVMEITPDTNSDFNIWSKANTFGDVANKRFTVTGNTGKVLVGDKVALGRSLGTAAFTVIDTGSELLRLTQDGVRTAKFNMSATGLTVRDADNGFDIATFEMNGGAQFQVTFDLFVGRSALFDTSGVTTIAMGNDANGAVAIGPQSGGAGTKSPSIVFHSGAAHADAKFLVTAVDQLDIQTNDLNRIRITNAATTYTNQVVTCLPTTAGASINLPHGAAPTSPVNGDMWTTTAGLFVRINGSTVGPLS